MIYNQTKYNKNWKTMKLNELGKFSRGKSKHRPRNDKKLFEGGGYPLVQTGEIKEANLYVNKHKAEYNEFGLSQSKLWDKDTLCITIAANIAETAILAYPMCFPDSIVGFNANKEVSSELFMHYIFTYIKQAIQKSASGSIQDNINIDYLEHLDFKIPDKIVQDKICNVLYNIDKKIENNNKTIKVLEELSKMIYDYWFLQYEFPNENGKPYKSTGGKMVYSEELKKEIPEGWKVKNFKDITEMYQPKTIPINKLKVNGRYNVYGANGIIGKYDKYNHEQNEIAVCCRGAACGEYLMTLPFSWVTGNAMIIKPKDDYYKEYIYYKLSDRDIFNYITGSAQPQITRTNIENMKLIIPISSVIEKFNKIATNIRKQIIKCMIENEELTKLRDYLLPLLMNGQISFKN